MMKLYPIHYLLSEENLIIRATNTTFIQISHEAAVADMKMKDIAVKDAR
jgi:hypothetical protein